MRQFLLVKHLKQVKNTFMDDRITNWRLDGGCLAFDFINTVSSRKIPEPVDCLEHREYLVPWLEKAGALPAAGLSLLLRHSEKHPGRTKRAFRKLLRARELLYLLFAAIARQEEPAGAERAELNALLTADFFAHTFLIPGKSSSQIVFSPEADAAEEPLWAILRSGWELLTTADYSRIRECPSCGWLFLDKSKNGRRRWCNMQTCGSNDKSTRYYHRKKARANERQEADGTAQATGSGHLTGSPAEAIGSNRRNLTDGLI